MTAAQQKRAEIFGAFFEITVRTESGFALLRASHVFALCFELRELLSGKNSFRVGQECFTALLCAACLHAFGLPRLDLGLLIRLEIQ